MRLLALKDYVALLACLLLVFPLEAAEHHGTVKFGDLPLPGATVTATLGDKTVSTTTDADGNYSFPDLADGSWNMEVEMQLFAKEKREVGVSAGAPGVDWALKLLSADEMAKVATAAPVTKAPETAAAPSEAAKPAGKNAKNAKQQAATNTRTPFQRTELSAAKPAGQDAPAQPDASAGGDPTELRQRAADGFLINGSSNNGAASPFAQLQAFGNNRRGLRSLYNGNIGVTLANSAFNARPYSFTGQDTPKPQTSQVQGLFSFGGPLKIPHLLTRNNGPQFFVNYQWTRNGNGSTVPALVPTAAERSGDLSQSLRAPVDPLNGLLFPDGIIPLSRFSPEAQALLQLYPLPNFTGSSRYNFQVPLVSGQHQDDLQTRMNKQIGRKDQVFGIFALQSIRTDTPSMFGFLDTGRTLGMNTSINWRHNFTNRLFGTLGYTFTRFATRTNPYFAGLRNVSAEAGISGNNQDPVNWGPPSLNFSNGIQPLSDAIASFTRNETNALNFDGFWSRGRHNVSFGENLQKQQFNLLSQQNPRGAFTFTGAGTGGSDLASFLLGTPDTSAIAFGNADKYLRATNISAYVNDDWRVNPSLTLNFGIRYEYWSPVTEKYGRLVNLAIGPGFSTATPVIANQSPDPLIQPDRNNFAPRVSLSWRPIAASSMVIRAGYGVYYDTSVFQTIATQMAQQAPLSTSVRVDNSPDAPLTLANGFPVQTGGTATTFGIDPNFRLGYSQNWQASVQRDLPWGLQMVALYMGVKGTRAQQEFLPNTYPLGTENICQSCPTGFTYLVSNGNSTREAGQLQLRRRLRSGFTAQLQYTWSKSIDDATLGGRGATLVAQNWLDLAAERGLSNFDQRHLLNASAQYTTGEGLHGGALASGWRAALLKEWTVLTQINAGTGLPLTPAIPYATTGTGVTGSIRPDYTGADVYAARAGLNLNPDAYVVPAKGQWGNAARNSITGPGQFTMNAGLSRTFRSSDRVSFDFRVDATNILNHVTFPSWVTTVGSAQFGLPLTANGMRTLQTTFRARF